VPKRSRSDQIANFDKDQVLASDIDEELRYDAARVLARARTPHEPVLTCIPPEAVIWVNLDPGVVAMIRSRSPCRLIFEIASSATTSALEPMRGVVAGRDRAAIAKEFSRQLEAGRQ
jgi:hypothetical protein